MRATHCGIWPSCYPILDPYDDVRIRIPKPVNFLLHDGLNTASRGRVIAARRFDIDLCVASGALRVTSI
jgi:hypothetical protein